MRTGWWLATITVCFAARLAFYAAAVPLWEGFDEWAHFSVVRAVADEGRLIVPRGATIPLDIAASMQYAPMPRTLRNLPPDAISHERFWSLPPEERDRRERQFRSIPREFRREHSQIVSYAASVPPLSYWIMAPVLRAARGAGLAAQVLVLRWVSIVIALLLIPLVFWIGRTVFADDRVALGCAAGAALMPELAIDMARVSNEALAVALYSTVILLALRRRDGWALGAALGAGLLTKSYMLAAFAGVALVVWAPRALGLALVTAGWWYARNLWTSGTITGWRESVSARGTSPWALLQQADQLPWASALDTILKSHLYLGGWSSLTVPHWFYHAIFLLIGASGLGALTLWAKPDFRSLLFLYATLWVAQLYQTMLIYVTRGVPASFGWYLYAAIGAQATLTVAGLRRIFGGRAIWILALIASALDLYAMHFVMLPYYTGGAAGWAERFRRLTAFKPDFLTAPTFAALWVLYLAGTMVLVGASVRLARGVKRA